MQIDKFLELNHVTNIAPHPSGKSIAVTVSRLDADKAERISELWSVPLDGDREQEELVADELGVSSANYDEAGGLYFLSKRPTAQDDARDVRQVWRIDEAGTPEQLTDEPLGVIDFKVHGETLVVLAPVLPDTDLQEQRATSRDRAKNGPTGILFTGMTVRSWDRWLGGARPHLIAYAISQTGLVGRRDLTPSFERELDQAMGLAWDVSADGKTLASECHRWGPERMEDASVLIIDIASGEHRHIGHEDGISHLEVLFSPSGKTIATVRHRREPGKHGARSVVTYDIASGRNRERTSDWQASPTLESFRGENALLITSPMYGHVPVYELSLNTDSIRRITSVQSAGSHMQVRPIGDNLVGIRTTFARAPEVFRIPLETEATPLLCSKLSGMPNDAPLCEESLECAGAGGTPIQYFFLAPRSSSNPRPTLLWIHGGPVHSWTDGWHWRWNPLPFLAAGYNVVCPNPRGSTGFGQDFIDEIVGNEWGDACYRDVMAVADAIVDRDDVDSERVAVMGGSFGGYMSNWIGTQTDRFCAIITHASLYRLSAFQGTTDWPAYWAHDMGLYPSDDPECYDRYSPHRFVDNWKTPTLITHGEKDYRVPISEALMLFEDLQRREVDSRLLVFPDENHWILRPRNVALWYQSCLDFLSEHTKTKS